MTIQAVSNPVTGCISNAHKHAVATGTWPLTCYRCRHAVESQANSNLEANFTERCRHEAIERKFQLMILTSARRDETFGRYK